jgi:hypothetical protein
MTDDENRNICALSQHRDGKWHTWRWDGDDPRIICHWCDELRDALTGRVIRPGRQPVVTTTEGEAAR